LKFLASKASCQCGDIVDELPLSQSTVSQHLKELKDAGLIKGEIEGVKVCYCIDEKEWKARRFGSINCLKAIRDAEANADIFFCLNSSVYYDKTKI
jgi:DNA-binding transcriptional ArsR family regulator